MLPGCLLFQPHGLANMQAFVKCPRILSFYLVLSSVGGVQAAREARWLWEPFPALTLDGLSLADVRWSVVLGQWDAILSLLPGALLLVEEV